VRILYVNKMWPVGEGGGGEVRLWQIARRLAARGHEVTIVCGRHRPDLPAKAVVEGVALRTVRVLPGWVFHWRTASYFLARYLFYLLSGPAIARAVPRADVVVDCATPIASSALAVARRFGRPCLITVYETFGRDWFRVRGPVTAMLGYLGEGRLFRGRYDGYITLSPDTAAQLRSRGVPAERIHRVAAGAAAERPSPRDPRARGSTPLPEVVCLARLVPQKNVAALLRVWPRVLAAAGPARLRIVGEGSLRPALERATVEAGISDSVWFEGFVPEERKWQILDGADLFAFPSLREGWGLALLEAGLAALPVVAYDLPVYSAFVENGTHGLLVRAGDEGAFAEAVIRLLRDPAARRRMGEQNEKDAVRYDWDRATDEEERTLGDALGSAR
jgi:glycosyltransferase involved in cell wall biosynthesis